ncbi:MAG TPA: hypothetical protein VFW11_12015 [Cyclobacteriaceae bacterium]|nr:hypothetical protein [Cyclobacteriaceae bacterium]
MRSISINWSFLIPTFFLVPLFAGGQVRSFEFSNPFAIELTTENLEMIMAREWRVVQVDTENRGNITETKGRSSLKINGDKTFNYSGKKGNWEILEGKYINYRLDSKDDETVLNFGGIYAVTNVTDTTLTLTKLLTSTHDMKRIIYLEDSKSYYAHLPNYQTLIYTGKLDQNSLDSISHLHTIELFETGFPVHGDTIFIHTQDSLYRVLRKIEKKDK